MYDATTRFNMPFLHKSEISAKQRISTPCLSVVCATPIVIDPSTGVLQRSSLGLNGRKRYADGEHGVCGFRGCERGLRRFGDRDRPHDRTPNQGEHLMTGPCLPRRIA